MNDLNLNLQNYLPQMPLRQDVGMNSVTSKPQSSPQMDAGLHNLSSPGALNFDTNLGSAHSGAVDMRSVMGANESKGINFLEDPNHINNAMNEAMNSRVNDANNNGMNSQNDQMQQLLSMLQNMIAMLSSMMGVNQSEGSDSTGVNYDDDAGNSSGLGSPENDTSERTERSSKSKKGKKSERSEKAEGSDGERKTEKNAKSDDAKGNDAIGTEKTSAASGVKGTSMPAAEFEKHFETEGNVPYQADGSQTFDAFASDIKTENGNGIRNENKIKEEDRVPMSASNESFSATVTPDVSPGTQSIISQWHGEGEGGLVKLYVDDQSEKAQGTGKGAENGVAGDGVFDVYTRYTDKDGVEQTINHGTINEGESLDVAFDKQGNDFSANVNGTSSEFSVTDDEEVYFKYGMYLQTKDPINGDKAKPDEGGMDILAENDITKASATFDNVNFTREVV